MKPTRSCEAYIDGASRGNPGPAGVGVVVYDLPAPAGGRQAGGGATPVRQLSKYLGHATNNVAEYLALIYALQDALRAGCSAITVKSDSELLVRQLNGQYRVRDPHLRLFHDLALHLAEGFRQFRLEHIPRTQNRQADRLANHAVDTLL